MLEIQRPFVLRFSPELNTLSRTVWEQFLSSDWVYLTPQLYVSEWRADRMLMVSVNDESAEIWYSSAIAPVYGGQVYPGRMEK